MKKGFAVALMMGLATMLLAGLGMPIYAGTIADSARPRKAHQPDLLRARRARAQRSLAAPKTALAHVSRPTRAGQDIQSTRRISIPFGFRTPVMLNTDSQITGIAGHGGCTEGEQVTVAVTLTQTSTAALATGETTHVCSGDLQPWRTTVAPAPGAAFIAAPAQACGVAVTSAGDTATDRFEWCRAVDLAYGLYLPLVVQATR